MGYNTDFNGEFNLDKRLDLQHEALLINFAEDRHDTGACPGAWCGWVPNEDGTAIVWNEQEKFYDYIEWIKYLIEVYLTPWGYVVNGSVYWYGEEGGDTGRIDVENNVVTVRHGRIVYDLE